MADAQSMLYIGSRESVGVECVTTIAVSQSTVVVVITWWWFTDTQAAKTRGHGALGRPSSRAGRISTACIREVSEWVDEWVSA